jgi:hypothetical protein
MNQLYLESKKHIPDIRGGWPMVGTKTIVMLSANWEQYIMLQLDFFRFQLHNYFSSIPISALGQIMSFFPSSDFSYLPSDPKQSVGYSAW